MFKEYYEKLLQQLSLDFNCTPADLQAKENIITVSKLNEGRRNYSPDKPFLQISSHYVLAYGSPWSGKTHCYRNIAAPVGAIVRIRQEKENVIRRLRPIEAYGSVMASCSGFPIEERFTEGKSNTLQKIIKGAPCWELGCLPNVDAALVCSEAVVNN